MIRLIGTFLFKLLGILFLSILLFAMKCQRLEPNPSKIGFDLSQLDEEGLSKQPGGKVAIDYEFCIPAKEDIAKIVQDIDPSVRIQKTAKGRIECDETQWLCLGNTHQKDYKKILYDLTRLTYITRIEQNFFE